mmetsp:Transcript_47165/g.111203  ORF Transcript_47165/g.111203 Transcript_47165/m.111203 type:complete len:229 (+) Transcript_47165:550-1236(+)
MTICPKSPLLPLLTPTMPGATRSCSMLITIPNGRSETSATLATVSVSVPASAYRVAEIPQFTNARARVSTEPTWSVATSAAPMNCPCRGDPTGTPPLLEVMSSSHEGALVLVTMAASARVAVARTSSRGSSRAPNVALYVSPKNLGLRAPMRSHTPEGQKPGTASGSTHMGGPSHRNAAAWRLRSERASVKMRLEVGDAVVPLWSATRSMRTVSRRLKSCARTYSNVL